MARGKSSRKGKKAWRANIDASEVTERVEEINRKEARGETAVEDLQDDALFFIDKTKEDVGALSQQIKRSRGEKKLLRSEQIILGNKSRPVIPIRERRKTGENKDGPMPRLVQKALKRKAKGDRTGGLRDLWDDDLPSTSGREQGVELTTRRPGKRGPARGPNAVRAVEVDAAGCSINPEPEAHQDAIAQLVASEMKKILKRDLQPKAPPPTVIDDGTIPKDELEALLVDDDDDGEEEAEQDPTEVDDSGDLAASARQKKKTLKDRNRAKRHQEELKLIEQRKKLKQQRADIDRVKRLQAELDQEEEERQRKKIRREVVREEKAASQPPRLSKHRFEAPSVQVLLSDEVTGSLRGVRPCFLMAKDRFKSLQKRGLIEPRVPVLQKKGARVEYIRGERFEKQLAAHLELQSTIKAKKKAKKL